MAHIFAFNWPMLANSLLIVASLPANQFAGAHNDRHSYRLQFALRFKSVQDSTKSSIEAEQYLVNIVRQTIFTKLSAKYCPLNKIYGTPPNDIEAGGRATVR